MSAERDLTAALRRAAAAMPATQRLRFSRFLRGLEKRDRPDVMPGTPMLPAITIDRDTVARAPRRYGATRARPEPRQLRLL